MFETELPSGRVVAVLTPAGSELVLAILARDDDRYWVAEYGEGSLDRSRHDFWIVPAPDVAPLAVQADVGPVSEEVRIVEGRPACTPDILDQAWWWDEGEPGAAAGAAAEEPSQEPLGYTVSDAWDLGRYPGESVVAFRDSLLIANPGLGAPGAAVAAGISGQTSIEVTSDTWPAGMSVQVRAEGRSFADLSEFVFLLQTAIWRTVGDHRYLEALMPAGPGRVILILGS